jgi:hypothetical protein
LELSNQGEKEVSRSHSFKKPRRLAKGFMYPKMCFIPVITIQDKNFLNIHGYLLSQNIQQVEASLMTSKNELSSWTKQFIVQITKEWDWPVTYSIDVPEEFQTSYQIFLTLKKLQLSVVILFDRQEVEEGDIAELKDKINLGLVRLRELAEQRVVT